MVSGTILTFRLVARPLCTQPLCETTVTMFGRRPALLAPRQRWRPCCFPGSVPFMTSRPLRLPVPPSSASRHRAPRGGSDRPIAGPNSLEEIADPSYRHRWSRSATGRAIAKNRPLSSKRGTARFELRRPRFTKFCHGLHPSINACYETGVGSSEGCPGFAPRNRGVLGKAAPVRVGEE